MSHCPSEDWDRYYYDEEKRAEYADLAHKAGCFDDLLAALKDLVARCDGDEGVRADGSNIQTIMAHVVIARAEGRA